MPKKKPKEVRPEEKEALAESEGLSSIEEPLEEEASPVEKIVMLTHEVEPYKKIRYLGVSDIYKIKGPVTGIGYTFTTKERVSFVATEDYEALLQRVRSARRCCGGKTIPAQPYFGPAD